jgi:hypothetical protein
MPIALVFALLLAASTLPACSKKTERAEPQAAPASTNLDGGAALTQVDAGLPRAAQAQRADAGPPVEFGGTLRGVIKLAKGQKLPLAPFPVLSGGVPAPSVAPCPTVDASDQRTVSVAKQTGGLSPIHVAITGMSAAPPHEPVTHELFIDACRLRPAMIAAVRGDTVRVTNRSETALVPRVPGASYMRGLLKGETASGVLKAARTVVDCGFGSYCGDSLVIATTHPLAAVTTPEGFFTIEHVPLEQELRVFAWNPLFELTSQLVKLTHAQPEQMIELTLTPTAVAAATRAGVPKKVPEPATPGASDGGVARARAAREQPQGQPEPQ